VAQAGKPVPLLNGKLEMNDPAASGRGTLYKDFYLNAVANPLVGINILESQKDFFSTPIVKSLLTLILSSQRRGNYYQSLAPSRGVPLRGMKAKVKYHKGLLKG
jgi:hypothetical protein